MSRFDDLLCHIQKLGVGWIKVSDHAHMYNSNNVGISRKNNWKWSKEETKHYEDYDIIIYKDPSNGHKYYVIPDPLVIATFEKKHPNFYCR